jgi:hypothetical protein
MSDRRVFGAYNDTVNPEKSSGFSAFPFPYAASPPVGEEAYYPIALTLAKAIEWYHRIATWTATNDLAASVSNGTDGQATGMNSVFTSVTNSGPGGQLIPGAHTHTWDIYGTGTGVSSGVGTLSLFTNPFDVTNAYLNALVKDGDDYYPRIFVAFTVGASVSSTPSYPSDYALTQVLTNGFYGPPTGNLTVSIDGFNFTLPWSEQNAGSPSTFTYQHSMLDFTPASYWAFEALDASPIYDTTTGAQLQDPRN